MKKLFLILLCALMTILWVACGPKEPPVWNVNVEAREGCSLEETETPGTYRVIGDMAALAERDMGETYISRDILTLPAGNYEVRFVDGISYVNDGRAIRACETVTVDLTAEPIKSVAGKLFVGWLDKNGDPAENTVTLAAGEELTAKLVDFDPATDFFVRGAEVVTGEWPSLRFTVEKKNSFADSIPNILDYGTLMMATNRTLGREMYYGEPIITEWEWDEATGSIFTPKDTMSAAPEAMPPKNVEKIRGGVTYTATVRELMEKEYGDFYSVRGYILYDDLNGNTRVAYSDYFQTNLYKAAAASLDKAKGEEKAALQAIIDYYEDDRKTAYMEKNYDGRTLLSGYDTTEDTDPNHAMYELANGLKVREVVIDSGNEGEAVEIVHFADPHLNYINKKDIEIGDINTLSTYRGRAWLRDGSSVPKIAAAMEYASFFDQTVITGDIMDYFSFGCVDITKKMILDQDENVLMAVGNHEPAELMQSDTPGLSERYTLAEKYAMLSDFWPHDLLYTSRILTDDAGNEKVMLVVLDNQRDRYWAEQYEPFAADIALAREKNIPILVFQHDPICTYNPNETKVRWFYEPGDYSESGNHDFSARFAGSDETDIDTMEVYNLIVQNSDVIKGVFCGHWHNHMYTEIYARDDSGNFLKDENGDQVIIPQYVVTSNAYGKGNVIKITVE